jgi:hypothetical protein
MGKAQKASRSNSGRGSVTRMGSRAAMTSVIERRTERRRPLETEVTVRHLGDAGQPLEDTMVLGSTNVSGSGVFLLSELVLPQGELLQMSFQLPSGVRIEAHGEVTRVELGDAQRPSGMGVRFRSLDATARRKLKLFAD